MLALAPAGTEYGIRGMWRPLEYSNINANEFSMRVALYRSVHIYISLCISQPHLSFPTSISGQPIFYSASEAIASGKWIWWILSGNQHPSDCQILGEKTERLRSWFRARYTCPWGPGDGGRRLAKFGTSETPLPEFISILAKCDFGFREKGFTCINMSQLLKLLCVLH